MTDDVMTQALVLNHDPSVMTDDVLGRLRNMRLPDTKALWPLFEAIVNSIHAIEERDTSNRGRIDIQIIRSPQLTIDGNDTSAAKFRPITGFQVVDNGVGFTDENYNSFITADSRLKENKGGKGVGRFIWLKAFGQVSVKSYYKDHNNGVHLRTFDFLPKSIPITNYRNEDQAGTKQLKTTVMLSNIVPKYSERIPQDVEKIAERIIDHHVIYMMATNCPEIILHDEEAQESVRLNKKFKEHVEIKTLQNPILIKEKEFTISYLWVTATDSPEHRIVLTANQREVKSIGLHKLLPDVRGRYLLSKSGKSAKLLVVVSGNYLDEMVVQERTEFYFADSAEDNTQDTSEVTELELLQGITQQVENLLKDQLEKLQFEKLEQVKRFVCEKEPEYRVLLKHAKTDIARIPAGLSDDKLDIELHKVKHKIEMDIKQEGREYINSDIRSALDNPEFKKRYEQYVEKLLDLRSSDLAKYVLHRRTILELLVKILQRREDGKHGSEDEAHTLLFPKRTTSDDVEYGYQNLWIIDEKLTYHFYLASDTELSKITPIENASGNRPDILVFDRPTAFAEGEHPFQSVVIIELKRPERKGYADDEDPIKQIYGYIRDLLAGKVYDKNGIALRFPEHTRFYSYIIADITNKLEELAVDASYLKTPDGNGFYGINPTLNAYVEIIGYRKLLEDAKKRNRVLFERLGLPSML